MYLRSIERDLPGRPVVKTLPLNAGDTGLVPGWGAEIPHALWPTEAIL